MQFRSFREDDFSSLIEAYDQAWGWEQGKDPLLRLQIARFYTADMIATSDEVIVAEQDGVFLGLACLSDPLLRKCEDDSRRARFRDIAQDAMGQLALVEGGRREIEFMHQLEKSGSRLVEQLRELQIGWDAELLFLLCAAEARGQGVGKALMDEALSRLKAAHRTGTVMLKTDTHCSWQFYPKHGWRQAASYEWPEAQDMTAYVFTRPIA